METTRATTPAGAYDVSRVRAAIDAANRRFVDTFNGGDPAGAARALYTRDPRILPSGAPMVRGRDAAAEQWTRALELGVHRVALTTLELLPLGDAACEIGRGALTLADGKESTVKYVALWQLEDGEWRLAVDTWNSDN